MTFTDGTRKTFNNSGYLTAITDRNGNKTAVNYDAANRITNVTDPLWFSQRVGFLLSAAGGRAFQTILGGPSLRGWFSQGWGI
jgi:YD repeat-containing protein